MNRSINSLLVAVFLLSLVAFNASAKNEIQSKNQTIEYFSDGSYTITEIKEDEISLFASGVKSGSKSKSYYDSDGNKEWTVTIHGMFNYNGSSATCTAATPSSQIFNSKWRVTSSTGTRSGNKAIGTFVMEKFLLGVSVRTVNETVTLTCSPDGTLS